ncbi:DUF3325 domain-containing protein [Stutzerimonas nosocomialis]|uniref:DUF3325 domain-containing protein n=1 Tax=Stutzerimonas nosocomialis TaxID=1056496 RepID=A0A5R9QFW5_9GAMM|nr:DUF3325 family protein [Stutzerimonas nosocomialis]TLX64021.1 DUF3325 domain-containing protein [Stutzerimonas nosocomialis]
MSLALIASLALAYAGMLGLCLGMERHWKQLASPRLPTFCRRLCTPLGGGLLGLSIHAATFAWPGGMAVVAWFGLISLGGLALLLLLPYAPRLALGLPLAGALLAGLLAML